MYIKCNSVRAQPRLPGSCNRVGGGHRLLLAPQRGHSQPAAAHVLRPANAALCEHSRACRACCTKNRDSIHTVPGIPSSVVDTIGAGDAHAGQVLASLAAGKSLACAVREANLVSSRVVSVKGASLSDEQYRRINFII